MKSNLQEALEEAGYICRSYSGRGMYSRECLAIVTSHSLFQVGINLGWILNSIVDDLEEDDSIESAYYPQTDSMGKSDTVIYWKNVEFVPDDGIILPNEMNEI